MARRRSSVQQRIDALETNQLECRSIGHAWRIRWWGSSRDLPEELVPEVTKAFRWDLVRVSTCLRCSTIRDEFYPRTQSTRFQVQYRRYRYADGYVLDGIGQSPRRAEFSEIAYERWVSGEDGFLR